MLDVALGPFAMMFYVIWVLWAECELIASYTTIKHSLGSPNPTMVHDQTQDYGVMTRDPHAASSHPTGLGLEENDSRRGGEAVRRSPRPMVFYGRWPWKTMGDGCSKSGRIGQNKVGKLHQREWSTSKFLSLVRTRQRRFCVRRTSLSNRMRFRS
jgi:hypothetical protein